MRKMIRRRVSDMKKTTLTHKLMFMILRNFLTHLSKSHEFCGSTREMFLKTKFLTFWPELMPDHIWTRTIVKACIERFQVSFWKQSSMKRCFDEKLNKVNCYLTKLTNLKSGFWNKSYKKSLKGLMMCKII